MCGINGIFHFGGFEEGKQDDYHFANIRVMNEAIAHRGPDEEGVFVDYPVSLGFRRLSIIDLSEHGNQPMFNEDGSIVIVFNGEIYNYKELMPELLSKGHIFKSKCDTEVVIHAYEEYGEDCVKTFNGMWAFVIYDLKKKKLFASRDRFGVKPFYYYKDNQRFIFSSEIKAILKLGIGSNANHCKVFNYLAYGYSTNDGRTFFKHINELPPAHNLSITQKSFSVKRYWDFPERSYNRNNLAEDLRELVFDSVSLRFRSDVPVSILLSGVIDSGIIASVSNMLIEKGVLNNESVSAYSAVFPGFKYDESEQIKEILNLCPHISGHFISPSSEKLAHDLPEFVYGLGEPVFSSTSFAHYILMKEISKQSVKVVLNGQGSDEAWAGYGRYIIGYYLLGILISEPGKFFDQLRKSSDAMGLSTTFISGQILKALLPRRYASRLRSKYSEKIFGLMSTEFIRQNYGCFDNPQRKRISNSALDDYMKYNIAYQGFNQILHYEDHSSMQSSIEMRSPFIDYRLMELAFSIPSEKKLSDGITKRIVRDAFRDLLPESVVNSKRKIGFATPFEDWAKEPELAAIIKETLGSDQIKKRFIYRSGSSNGVAERFRNNPNFPLWRILNLELWIKSYGVTNL